MADQDFLRLSDLPVEVLSMIFSLTDSADRVNLAKVCQRFDFVLQRRELNRSVDLQRSYDLDANDIYTFLKNKTRCNFITSVNLTSCYWIPSAIIKKSLIRLKNLVTLLVADTKLTCSDLKALVVALPKVTNIAFSWNGPVSFGLRTEDLKSVCMYVPSLYWDPSLEILNFLKLCKTVENISIIVSTVPHEEDVYAQLRFETVSLPYLRSLLITVGKRFTSFVPTIKGSISYLNQHLLASMLISAIDSETGWESFFIPFNQLDPIGPHFSRILYLKRRAEHARPEFLTLERACVGHSDRDLSLFDDSVWPSLSKLRSMSLYWGCNGVDSVIPSMFREGCRLEELNLFGHYNDTVFPLCRNITASLSSSGLRKLCIPAFAIWREKASQPIPSDARFQGLGKRPRVSHIQVTESPTKSPFENLVLSCPNIEVFVMENTERDSVWELPERNLEWDPEQLVHIANWKKLKKLTLGDIPISSFIFLDKIGRSCPNVTSLSLNYFHLTAAAVNMSGLIRALPLFNKLEDLVVRQPRGISVLHALRQNTLRRVVLICDKISGPDLGEFLTNCDKVVFLYIVCDISKAEAHRIRIPLLKRFADRQALIFHIVPISGRQKPEEPTEVEAKAVPGIHANEMLTRGVLIGGPRPGDSYIQCE